MIIDTATRSACTRGIGVDIFTQGKKLDEVMENLKETVELHFEDQLHAGKEIRILKLSEIEILLI
nr:type II toxin-antitoxin system HicB family antitoxin [Candidatus Sigynarchaeota archaeon]